MIIYNNNIILPVEVDDGDAKIVSIAKMELYSANYLGKTSIKMWHISRPCTLRISNPLYGPL